MYGVDGACCLKVWWILHHWGRIVSPLSDNFILSRFPLPEPLVRTGALVVWANPESDHPISFPSALKGVNDGVMTIQVMPVAHRPLPLCSLLQRQRVSSHCPSRDRKCRVAHGLRLGPQFAAPRSANIKKQLYSSESLAPPRSRLLLQ